MELKEIISKQNDIEKSIDFLEKETNRVYSSFEKIQNCFSNECQDKRKTLRDEMTLYLNKLRLEEGHINKTEKEWSMLTGRHDEST